MPLSRVLRNAFSFLTMAGLSRRYQRRIALLKITAAQTYVSGVQKTRFAALAVLMVCFALIFFISGLILLEMALFKYSSLSQQAKLIAAAVLGAGQSAAALAVIFWLFRESTWIRFMKIDEVVRSVAKDKDHRGGKNETKTR